MKQKIFILIITLLIHLYSNGQGKQKIFYDKNWKVCNQSQAEFFRIVSLDENGKPFGKVQDFYITGELQWEGAYSYFDRNDNKKDIAEGLCTWYYKNGNRSQSSLMVNGKQEGVTTIWNEDGEIVRESYFKNGIPDGLWIDYYSSGKPKLLYGFRDGKPTTKWFIECDEFEKCQKVFYEGFQENGNQNEWPLESNTRYRSDILKGQGLEMETFIDEGFSELINVPIEISANFSIETSIDFIKGDLNSGQGLIWGMKDWNNYYYFYISSNGYYKIGLMADGINLPMRDWTSTNYINQNSDRNLMKVLKIKDQLYYSVNRQLIENFKFYGFRGNNIGFKILSGKKNILFRNLIIREDITSEELTPYHGVEASAWKGNATGFFISTNGYIATNYHVIEDASDIEIEFLQNNLKKTYKAIVVSSDKQNDLAIIKISDLRFTSTQNLPYKIVYQISDVGSNVFALGYPMALSVMGEEIKFTDGKISSKTGFEGNNTTYQISVPLQPGNSGGPLFDYDGNVIGIVSGKISKAENVSYAIKSSFLKDLISTVPGLISNGEYSMTDKTLTEKIKVLSGFVVMVKIK